jgi:hypothetical protein
MGAVASFVEDVFDAVVDFGIREILHCYPCKY